MKIPFQAGNILIPKKNIDRYCGLPQQEISIDYDDSGLLETDKIRVKKEIKKYASQKLGKSRRW